MNITITAEAGTHVAAPGRYARVAVRPITTYEAEVNGRKFVNRNLAEIKSAIKFSLIRSGVTEKPVFTIVHR
jgi:hypothetical protein